MRIILCNEILLDVAPDFHRQCELTAEIGYQGLELAPASLAERPHLMAKDDRAAIVDTAKRHGLAISGLHWLLAGYPELSITSNDPDILNKTQKVLICLVELCADLGGRTLVHGSPGQRKIDGAVTKKCLDQVADFFAPIAERAGALGVAYCIEPLSRHETSFINTFDEARDLVARVDRPAFKTMIDASAAGLTESESVPELIARALPTGDVAHIQLNDTNRGAPGTGNDDFAAIIKALKKSGYDGDVAIEPFERVVDGAVTAAIGFATVKALMDSVS